MDSTVKYLQEVNRDISNEGKFGYNKNVKNRLLLIEYISCKTNSIVVNIEDYGRLWTEFVKGSVNSDLFFWWINQGLKYKSPINY